MLKIIKATNKDIECIERITKQAFLRYQKKINTSIKLDALYETTDDIIFDIKMNAVFVAKQEDKVLGAIRYKILDKKSAYIYRFAVDACIDTTGVGSALLEFTTKQLAKCKVSAVCLHTNVNYLSLCRYYQNHGFVLDSVCSKNGYPRGLFIKKLEKEN